MLSALLAITIAIAIWQLTEYGEQLFAPPPAESVNATVQVSPPAFMPEYIPPSAASQRQNNLRNPTPAEIYQLTTRRPAPPPPIQNPANAAANPAVPLASPLASPLGSVPKPAVVQPTAPAATTTPAAQPVAGKPAPVAPSQGKEAAATKALASPVQPAVPASTQPE